MATVFKAIKPQRLKEDVFRLSMLNAMRKFGTELKHEYQKTTSTWSHQPKWEVLVSLSGSLFTVLVDTSDKIFAYVDRGTGEAAGHGGKYPITPKKGKSLHFREGFVAKTVPGVVGSLPGTSGSGKHVFRRLVMHPGIKPRDFTKNIEKVYRGKFKKYMQEAVADFAKSSSRR